MNDDEIREIADRIEAAHRREREAGAAAAQICGEIGEIVGREAARQESLQGCNAAAMRDALLVVKRLFDGRIMFQPAIRKAHEAVNAALAAPPRNCDRFGGDIDKLREACARERGLNPEEDFPDVFPDWLLALAKESGVRK